MSQLEWSESADTARLVKKDQEGVFLQRDFQDSEKESREVRHAKEMMDRHQEKQDMPIRI